MASVLIKGGLQQCQQLTNARHAIAFTLDYRYRVFRQAYQGSQWYGNHHQYQQAAEQ